MGSGGVARVRSLVVLSCVGLVPAACQDTGSSSDRGGEVTDSAGVELVANPLGGVWTEDDAWSVEEVLSLDAMGADEASQFGDVAGLDVDAEGRIYVADAQARTIRVFDSSGSHVRSIGQAGSGPGEFGGNVAGVFIADGELLVPDLSNQRVSRFDLEGTLISEHRLDMSRGIPIRFDMMGPGRLIAQRRLQLPGDAVPTAGDPIVTVSPLAEGIDTIARLGLGQSVQITGGIPRIRAFEPDPMWDSAPSGKLVTAMSDAWRFTIHGAGGSVERVISRSVDRRPVGEREREAVRRGLREMYASQGVPPELAEQVISAMEFGEYLPAYAGVALGPEDSLWVQTLMSVEELAERGASVDVGAMGSREWSVFNAEGRYLGLVEFPVRFRPIRVVDDRFYGVAEDELDVQTVKVFRVVTD